MGLYMGYSESFDLECNYDYMINKILLSQNENAQSIFLLSCRLVHITLVLSY